MKLDRAIAPTQGAFTLIELILAIAVMAIVMIAINAVFFSAMRLRDSATRAVDESLPIQQTLATMRHDLQGAMPPTSQGVMSGDFRVGSITAIGTGQPADIELFTTTGVMHEDEPWGDVQEVTYSLRVPQDRSASGKDLYRSVTRNILATVTPTPEDQWMMSGVDSLQFSCYDGSSWYDTWDSTVTTNVPSAVRVRIFLAGQGGVASVQPIEMMVPIDSQIRTNLLSQ